MTRFRFACDVDTKHLGDVVEAAARAAVEGGYPADITIMPLHMFDHLQPNQGAVQAPAGQAPKSTAEEIHELHPAAPKKRVRRASAGNGGSWPAPGSIYDTVLQSLAVGPKTPKELRDVLTEKGFSAGSINSSLGRLEKRGRITKGEAGAWAAVV